MSRLDDELQEEVMRYGNDPVSCPACWESLTRMCKFHRETESSGRWCEWACRCGAVMVTLGPRPEDGLCSLCRAALNLRGD